MKLGPECTHIKKNCGWTDLLVSGLESTAKAAGIFALKLTLKDIAKTSVICLLIS